MQCKWHSHAYDMESQMICHDRARKQERVGVEGKKYARRQHQTILLFVRLIPCQPRAREHSIRGQAPHGLSFQQDHCQTKAATSTKEEQYEIFALLI
eukprot:5576602-Amphidinium_carterae.1